MLRLRSVSISVLDIRDLRTSSLRIDSSTSGATLKLVLGGWSGLFAKSMFTSGPTIRVSTTTPWPSLIISLLTISPGPRRDVISPAIVFNPFTGQDVYRRPKLAAFQMGRTCISVLTGLAVSDTEKPRYLVLRKDLYLLTILRLNVHSC